VYQKREKQTNKRKGASEGTESSLIKDRSIQIDMKGCTKINKL
jgi:hypothetical protein